VQKIQLKSTVLVWSMKGLKFCFTHMRAFIYSTRYTYCR